MFKKKEAEIHIDDLLIDGAGVGRTPEGQAVFVPGALPGEMVRAQIVHKTKKYLIGEREEILTPSPMRRNAPCAVFEECGGCTLQHLDYPGQLDFKWSHVKSCLAKIGGIETEVGYPLPSRNEFFYRNKAAFPVGHGDRGIKIGCYARKSHVVVDHQLCMLQTPESDVCIRVVKKWAKQFFIEPYSERFHKGLLRHVIVRISNLGEVMVGIVINGESLPHGEELVDMLVEEIPNLASVILNLNIQRTNVILGSRNLVLYGRDYIVQNISGFRFRISLHTFLQVNSDQTEALYANIFKMAGLTKEMTVADLYCGAGTITLHAAKRAKFVYGIEIVPQAVEDARRNAEDNGVKNVKFFCGDCAEAFQNIQSEGARLDAVIVDPPRKGLDPGVIAEIAAAGPGKVVYVSCDPATLARDIALFVKQGYAVQSVQPVDMFPQTTHVETVVLLSKLNTKQHIEVELNLDELDLTAAESKATYDEIKAYVLEKYGLKVSSLYISQVKRKCGLEVGQNYNLSKKEDAKVPQCPPEKEAAIMEALRHFQMI